MKNRLLRFLSRIWIRLLAFNFLLVFLPIAALWSLENTEKYLLDLQEKSNIQQGRLLSAALGGRGSLEGKEAQRIIRNLEQRIDARLRIIDADNNLLADSSLFGPQASAETTTDTELESKPEVQDTWLYRLGSSLYQLYARAFRPPRQHSPASDFYATSKKIDGKEIRQALAGEYGKAYRLSNDRTELILYSAIPIKNAHQVIGVALASKSTTSVLQRIYTLRFETFKVVLFSIGVAIVLSLLVSMTIVQPISRLRDQALAILDRRGRLKGRFKVYQMHDEIGDLSRSLHELTRRLEEHICFIEGFASDVSHEFKNPLASIRTATDLLAEVEDEEKKQHFHHMVLRDLARLERLLSGVREITRIDAQLEEEPVESVRLDKMLRGLVEQFELRRPPGDSPDLHPRYQLELPDELIEIEVTPYRLAQVFENLLDNARSFAPPGSVIQMNLDARDQRAVIQIADQGPGIPEEHLDRIFSRFFSYRPQGTEARSSHNGLGLAIVKAIVEGFGGSVAGRNGKSAGAVFEVELPLPR